MNLPDYQPIVTQALDAIRDSVSTGPRLRGVREDADAAIQAIATLALKATAPDDAEAIRLLVGPLVRRLKAIEDLCVQLPTQAVCGRAVQPPPRPPVESDPGTVSS